MYDQKDQSYFALARRDVVPMVPHCKKLLDVGCGTGATAYVLKSSGVAEQVYGVELFEDAAREARTVLDDVICADISSTDLAFEEKSFDVILCLDVLEHLVDPWSVLTKLKQYLRDDGVLITSIPTIAYAPVILNLLRKRFVYEQSGVMDKTHLRWFTLSSMKEMFASSGFSVERCEPNRASGWKMALFTLLTLGLGWFYSIVQYRFILRKSS